ncbi:MAG: lysozyme family protein [Acidiferrobacteraceae bacterium]
MSTTYWQTNSQSLGTSYLSPDQLPQMLLEEEGDKPLPYFDSQGFASIGIGVNLTVSGNMALVLQQLGVINASQTMAQQQQLVAQFEQVIAQNSPSGTAPSPIVLQNALNTALQAIPRFAADKFSLSVSSTTRARRFPRGMTRRWRRQLLRTLLGVGLLATPPLAAAGLIADTPPPPFPYTYHFILTKGRHRLVCQADLKRLNEASYTGPPSCDQPETTKVPGFTPLHREALSAREVYTLFQRVSDFIANGVQGSRAQDEAFVARRKQLGLSPVWTLDEIKGYYMGRGYIKVWRYDPPVSIDNDGHPTNLVVWRGVPISNASGVCGRAAPMNYRDVYTQPQMAFVLAPGNRRLDIRTTKAIFGHSGPRYRFPNGMVFPGFRPLGTAMGVFQYRGLYYFDTFFNGWGGSRTSSFAYYPALTHTLGVFLRRHGHTREVCEYHMTQRRRPTNEDTP